MNECYVPGCKLNCRTPEITTQDCVCGLILRVATMALEQIKDAPLTNSEINDIARDALHIINYGYYDTKSLSSWGANIVELCKNELL